MLVDLKRYSKLLIIQYQNNFNRKFIEILTQLFIEQINNVILQYKYNFDVRTAENKQLDIIGSLIGLGRDLGLGYNVDDATYRFFILMKIAKNVCFYNNKDFISFFYYFFGEDIIFHDNHNMSVDYFIRNIDPNIIDILIKNKNEFLPAPAGVLIEVIKPLDQPIVCWLDIKKDNDIDPSRLDERVVFYNDVDMELLDGVMLDIDIIF